MGKTKGDIGVPNQIRKARLHSVLAGAILVCCGPVAAHATTDELVQQAALLDSQGHAAQAYAMLGAALATRAGDPDFDYAYGLAAADSNHPGQAIAAFQRVLAAQPDNSRARAEIARVYAMAGDIDTARATFDTVQNDPTVPDPVRARIGRLVRDYSKQIAGGGSSVTGYAEAELGYDSNINAATALTSITLPVFSFLGPATLGGAATRAHAGFYQLQAGISGATALSRQTRAYASVLGSLRDNFNSSQFDQAALTGTAGIAHTLTGGPVLSLSGQVQKFWLGHQGYRTTYGAIGRVSTPHRDGSALSFQAQYFRYVYDNDPARDADRFAGSVDYSGRHWFAGAGAGREKTVRATSRHLGYWFLAAQAGTETPLSQRTALLAGASIEHRDYDLTDPLFQADRRDTQFDASIGLRYILSHGISARPRLTYTRNTSNLKLYDYARFTASLALRAEF